MPGRFINVFDKRVRIYQLLAKYDCITLSRFDSIKNVVCRVDQIFRTKKEPEQHTWSSTSDKGSARVHTRRREGQANPLITQQLIRHVKPY